MTEKNSNEKIIAVKNYLLSLQKQIQTAISAQEQKDLFIKDPWEKPQLGYGISCVISDGNVIEKGGINFSHIQGVNLPHTATEKRKHLTNKNFQVVGLSVVMHPQNPFAPTAHLNLRFFSINNDTEKPIWWFGGGFDLTPYYGFTEDCKYWHEMAKKTCDPFGENVYREFKQTCDEYFFIKHRNEPRGIGGIFFDDLNTWGFERCFDFIKQVGETFLQSYITILQRRKNTPFSEAQREFQLYRRGRYVEFNLIYDRGTLFGLQTGGRVESILMSLPPLVSWKYNYQPQPGTPEEKLYSEFLQVKDWV